LIDVIGKTGRNWPIHDGMDQIKLIASSVKSAGKAPVDSVPSQREVVNRSRENSNNPTRDPHASLNLFAPREKNVNDSLPAVVAPRASARPPPRDYHDLFAGNESDKSPATPSKDFSRQRSESPSKDAVAPKAGAGKNYAPSRLFDNDENSPIRPSPDKNHSADHHYKANPAKYQHFDFADGTDGKDAPRPKPLKDVKSKHGSQWSFDDFTTPQKYVSSKVLRTNDVRHWGNSDDEVADSPVKVKKENKPRKDAETHFEFLDDGTPEGGRRLIGRPRGAGQNNGLGLYKNNLYDDEQGGEAGGEEPKGVKPIANTKDRRKDFDAHFTMTDDSPASKSGPQHISEDRAKAIKMMDANWSSYDQSPSQKENVPTSPVTSRPNTGNAKGPLSEATNITQPKGITVAGDGMGSRKGVSQKEEGPKGIVIGGDGMGGRKGTGRQWGFGDESDGEEVGGVNKPSKYRTGKTQGKNQAPGGDFWDF